MHRVDSDLQFTTEGLHRGNVGAGNTVPEYLLCPSDVQVADFRLDVRGGHLTGKIRGGER